MDDAYLMGSREDARVLRELIRWYRGNKHTLQRRRGGHVSSSLQRTLWEVKSQTTLDAAGAANNYNAYYTCYRLTIDHTDYNLGNVDPRDQSTVEDIVGCLPEMGYTTAPMLIPGDLIYGFSRVDDEGTMVHLGFPDPSVAVRWAKTRQAAQTSNSINCKLVTSAFVETGPEFGATILFSDAATDNGDDLDETVPSVQEDVFIKVAKIYGVWYVMETFTYMDICT